MDIVSDTFIQHAWILLLGHANKGSEVIICLCAAITYQSGLELELVFLVFFEILQPLGHVLLWLTFPVFYASVWTQALLLLDLMYQDRFC